MKKKISLLALSLSMLLAGCGEGSGTPTASPSDTPQATATQQASASSQISDDKTKATASPTNSQDAADIESFFGPLPKFSTTDIKGSAYDESIVSGSKITMVNYWATWCGPCRAEMPELAELAKTMPEGSQLIGVCLDGAEAKKDAITIMDGAGVEYINLLPDNALMTYASQIMGIPTTIFYDAEGKQVGEPIEGMMSGEGYRKEIEARLAML